MTLRTFTHYLLASFMAGSVPLPRAQAAVLDLPAPGTLVSISPPFSSATLSGMVIHPTDPFRFDFLIKRGSAAMAGAQKQIEYQKLIKYFFASLTVPDKDQWVNLSPYEKNRIIDGQFGRTEMGRDLLAQDYLLKQITSSLMHPDAPLGRSFWAKVYERAAQQPQKGLSVPFKSINKVWIVPAQAVIYESGPMAYIAQSHLKVMLEEDYLALAQNSQGGRKSKSRGVSISQITRDVILPELEREVNEGRNFAMLRQVFSGMILATWYKKTLQDTLLARVYVNKAKVKGVEQADVQENAAIYQRYLSAFKKGVYDFVKETPDPITRQPVPRKYFAGGVRNTVNSSMVRQTVGRSEFRRAIDLGGIDLVTSQAKPRADGASQAMTADDIRKKAERYVDLINTAYGPELDRLHEQIHQYFENILVVQADNETAKGQRAVSLDQLDQAIMLRRQQLQQALGSPGFMMHVALQMAPFLEHLRIRDRNVVQQAFNTALLEFYRFGINEAKQKKHLTATFESARLPLDQNEIEQLVQLFLDAIRQKDRILTEGFPRMRVVLDKYGLSNPAVLQEFHRELSELSVLRADAGNFRSSRAVAYWIRNIIRVSGAGEHSAKIHAALYEDLEEFSSKVPNTFERSTVFSKTRLAFKQLGLSFDDQTVRERLEMLLNLFTLGQPQRAAHLRNMIGDLYEALMMALKVRERTSFIQQQVTDAFQLDRRALLDTLLEKDALLEKQRKLYDAQRWTPSSREFYLTYETNSELFEIMKRIGGSFYVLARGQGPDAVSIEQDHLNYGDFFRVSSEQGVILSDVYEVLDGAKNPIALRLDSAMAAANSAMIAKRSQFISWPVEVQKVFLHLNPQEQSELIRTFREKQNWTSISLFAAAQSEPPKNAYEVLGVAQKATDQQIHEAWRKEYYARQFSDSEHYGEDRARVELALEKVRDERSRAAYDEFLRRHNGQDPDFADKAMPTGGIDFNSANMTMTIRRDRRGLPLPAAQQDLTQFQRIAGFEPQILSIQPGNRLFQQSIWNDVGVSW